MAFLNGLVQGQITQNMPSHLGRIPSTCSEYLSGLYVHLMTAVNTILIYLQQKKLQYLFNGISHLLPDFRYQITCMTRSNLTFVETFKVQSFYIITNIWEQLLSPLNEFSKYNSSAFISELISCRA